jgi:hypothetical protein
VSTTGRGRLWRRCRRRSSDRRGIQTARSVEDGERAAAWMVVDGGRGARGCGKEAKRGGVVAVQLGWQRRIGFGGG